VQKGKDIYDKLLLLDRREVEGAAMQCSANGVEGESAQC